MIFQHISSYSKCLSLEQESDTVKIGGSKTKKEEEGGGLGLKMALVALVCCVIGYDHSPGTQTHELLSLSAETLMLIRSWSLR